MLAYRPDEFRAFMAYDDALMDKEDGLTKAEREMIVVATSAANQSNTVSSPMVPSCASGPATH